MRNVADTQLTKKYEKYYTVKDISKILNMHEESIRRAIRQGRLDSSKFGRDHRISHNSLMEFMQSKKYKVHSKYDMGESKALKGTAEALLEVFGKWEGDDNEEILDLIYSTRSKAEF